ncbi:LysR family transcriptional regulator [Actinomycetospora lemnae]|uniref:LysR substrate-binding domain-containing protein n=1 Tax=Actinomycetospora lemnae TaxID=3019891 RepID=A0ABT5SS21_9PSEU|nr:LysR substrate-binding domain-containing protein [Actinomycetospora sp. DW7H6]MDD7964533.1 LysR substrate-binding domain-containing protein [Actinomycetospora sp. DW7H6]
MNDVTLRQLEYLVAIARDESISRAAVRCHVSQAAISQALRELESSLGVQLAVRRTAKGVHLTPAGRTVANRARGVLQDVRQLVGDPATGPLTIGCFPSLAVQVVPEVAALLHDRFPEATLEVVEGPAAVLQDRMLRGQIDVCFLYEMQLQSEVTSVLLRERRFKVALAADHPLAAQSEVRLADLAGHPGALLDIEPASYLNEALLARFGVTPRFVYRSSDVATVRALVGRGLAWALLMTEVAASHDGRPLRFLPIVEDVGTNSLVAALPRGIGPAGLVEHVLRHCATVLPR